MLNALPSDVKSKVLSFLIKRCYITITENSKTRVLDLSLVYTSIVPNLVFDTPTILDNKLVKS